MILEYIFTCDVCTRTFERFIESQEVTSLEGVIHLYREFPINWSYIHGMTVCGNHTVEIEKDAIYIDARLVKVLSHG
jgi:hypothetical protein